MKKILKDISVCQICVAHLPHAPRPVLSISKESKILIVGQAPGRKVNESGIPWDDISGKILRKWLGVSDKEFYDKNIFGIMPMAFCYPGKGKSGDLPPRKECAEAWHKKLLQNVKPELIILIGAYAQNYYLPGKKSLTENVINFETFLPNFLPIPHPSPLNRRWLKNNAWFEEMLVPKLQNTIRKIINNGENSLDNRT